MKTRAISGGLALGLRKRVIIYLGHELVFLDLGSCPDMELEHRKEPGQDDWEERSSFRWNSDVRSGQIGENSLLGTITGRHVYTNRQRQQDRRRLILDIQCNVSTKTSGK